MNEIRKPLKRSLLCGITLFIFVLCIVLMGAQHFSIRRSLYRQYESRISNILNFARSKIDPDDLAECIRTGQESEKFRAAQLALDEIKEQTGVHYLYVIIPLNAEKTDNIRNVMAAATQYEYENEPETLVRLNELTGDAYSPEAAKKYLEAYGKEGDNYFENTTAFGTDYTGLRVLKDSRGQKVAALCADFDVNAIREQLYDNVLDILVIIVIVGLLFASAFIVWVDTNVIRPIRQLEKGVRGLAEKSQGQRNPDAMQLDLPEIRTGNEVESLARASQNMLNDMREYVKDLLKKEKELAKLSTMANRDPLTRVGNRNAYESFAEALQLKMSEGPQEYAILVMNTNGLKKINDEHGHENGDLYLLKACRFLCEIFRHTPVFRLGGDEFAAVMSGEDYRNRTELVKQIRKELAQAETDETAAPWERISAAIGITDYDRKNDRTVKAVMERAEKIMREDKRRMRRSNS
ncbi:MAG: GGDEF domain-containing protein [Clostridiales bacterium]|nr:GGDEF domain-containing protein [Clostridiales bacterium]